MSFRAPHHNPKLYPPLRRVVGKEINDFGREMDVLSCGRLMPHAKNTRHRKLRGLLRRCLPCLAEGFTEEGAADKKQQCVRWCGKCGCRLRRGNKGPLCAPCENPLGEEKAWA